MKYKAKFSKETKFKVCERDNFRCIICKGLAQSIHHAYFGTESNYGKDRNDISQGVSLCMDCHNKVHGCSKGEGIRQECINYLQNLNK